MKKNLDNETGLAIGLSFLMFFVLLLVWILAIGVELAPPQRGLSSALVGLYLMCLGVLPMISYYFHRRSFLFRRIVSLYEIFSGDSSRMVIIIHFTLGILLGGGAFLIGVGAIPAI